MYKGSAIYRLTFLGKKIARSVRPSNRESAIDYLYSSTGRTSSLEDLALHCFGGNGSRARITLSRLERRGLVEELTSEKRRMNDW